MKLKFLNFAVLLITILLICDESGVEAKKKKQGKGNDKYQIKSNNNQKENKDHTRNTRELGKEYENKKQEKYNKKQDNKYKNKENYNTKDSKNKFDKQKQYANKKNDQKYKGKTKEEIKKEYVNKKTEKITKKFEENIKQDEVEDYLNKKKNETLVIMEPKIITDDNDVKIIKELNENNNDIETIENSVTDGMKIINVEKSKEKESCEKSNNCNQVNEDKLLQCNKKRDSVKRNTTEICEKYKSEKNTQVFEEQIITDKQEVTTNGLDSKQNSKCEL